jgi:hypothetical protein
MPPLPILVFVLEAPSTHCYYPDFVEKSLVVLEIGQCHVESNDSVALVPTRTYSLTELTALIEQRWISSYDQVPKAIVDSDFPEDCLWELLPVFDLELDSEEIGFPPWEMPGAVDQERTFDLCFE